MRDSKRDTDINNSLLDSGRRQRWDDLREWHRNMYSIIHETDRPYVKQIAGPGLMHETGCSGLVHWDDPEGWDGEGGGRGFRMGDTRTSMADSCQCMAKTTTIL